MNRPIHLAFVWHMHQPFYKDLVTGEYALPWVRLHAIKDYYDMVAILDDFPAIKQTFNLVPSLLEQAEDYVEHNAMDKHLKLSHKSPSDLSHEDRVFILQNFFMANWETMVHPYKRYQELLLKRGRFVTLEEIKSVAKRFTEAELMDLQVWFNLTWFGHIYKIKDPLVKGLLEKGKNFTQEEKSALLNKQKELMAMMVPKYRSMSDSGQIEITLTPYYHPILPLIIDTNSAKESMPHIALPEQRFRHPEDAKYQVEQAVEYGKKLFGRLPAGMWPSEGSVSEEIVPIIAGAGIKWIATDEEVLARSLGRNAGGGRELSSQELFKPYRVEVQGNSLDIIFRDHNLSDLIGFMYSKWDPRDAASDFISHMNNIRASLPDDGKNYLVSVILDGENAWEYYRNNGWDFLSELYKRISEDKSIITTRVCDFLAANPPVERIGHLFAGSWINHNFRVWIGHEEDNKAWDHLAKARFALESVKNADPLAWKELYIAEGSDWCWWYGDDHSSENDETFDQLFRKHLKNIYHLIGKQPPQYLDVPIKQVKAIKPTREPADIVKPVIDGEITNYYEWLAAGYYDIGRMKGAMHQSQSLVKGLYYGFDTANFHVRLDVSIDLGTSEAKELSFGVVVIHPRMFKVMSLSDPKLSLKISKMQDDHLELIKSVDTVAIKSVVEMSIPYEDIGVVSGDEVQFIVIIEKGGNELERWPRSGSINFSCPTPDFMERQWTI